MQASHSWQPLLLRWGDRFNDDPGISVRSAGSCSKVARNDKVMKCGSGNIQPLGDLRL
jgi:hypothetical protein